MEIHQALSIIKEACDMVNANRQTHDQIQKAIVTVEIALMKPDESKSQPENTPTPEQD